MVANSSLTLTELDVLTLESSLKEYMRSQDVFRDYDFDGSNVSALIRIMAYNTWKNSWYLNQVHSESFLDTAQTRSSVISHAKELNYVPRSARSAKGTLRLSFTGTEPTYVIPKGGSFSSTVNNRGLIFSVPESRLITSTTGNFSVDLDVYEGRFVRDTYVFSTSNEIQRLVITNENVDTRSLVVVVFEDGDTSGVTYTQATTLLGVTETDRVYFLQATENGKYEILFGDGVIGRKPADGSVIVIEYRITQGEAGNGAKQYSRDFAIGDGVTNATVTSLAGSTNGAAAESLESIRYYAPRHFQVQERAVIASDYAIMLKQAFPEIRAVSAYGGEETNPPMYGKVILAIDVEDVDGIPQSKADEYYDFLRKRNGLTVEPIFVEPKYTYAAIRSVVSYNVNITSLTPENISAIVSNEIFTYADDFLNDFEKTLRYSKLVGLIDRSHSSIVSNDTVVDIYKKVEVERGVTSSFIIDFNLALSEEFGSSARTYSIRDRKAVKSTNFTVSLETRYVTDDGDGGLWVATDRGQTSVLLNRVGTVDYTTGRLTIVDLYVEAYEGGEMKFYAVPESMDVAVRRDTILSVETGEVRITIQTVRE